MFDSLNNAITSQLKRSIKAEVTLSDVDQLKLDYSIDAIIGDLSKFAMLLVFFFLINRGIEFVYFSIVALPLRNFTGGIHMKTYNTCFLFSLFYALTAIIMMENISMDSTQLVYISLFSIIIILLLAPISSKSRPKYSPKQRLTFKLLGITWLLINLILYIHVPDLNYVKIVPWAITIHTLQLLGGKLWQY